jgi:XTP/dITP diphosphohydrolase
MQIVLATNNEDKIKEIRQLLDGHGVEVLTRNDFQNFPDPEETGKTLEENAKLKAKAISVHCKMIALADDSGLEVDFLDGAPGVFSSRFAGENCTYLANNEKLLSQLKSAKGEQRAACFRCVIAIAWDPAHIVTIEGRVDGLIADKLAGSEGFGYDPVFYHPPSDKRFSEMTVDEKNKISHRGLALVQARSLILKRLNKV